MTEDKKLRKIDQMTQEQIDDFFVENCDAYSEGGLPLMSRERYLKVIAELTKDITK